MNKKVMALAVAGALAAPVAALAQVQIGGSIHLQYFNHDGDNASASKETDVLTTSEPELYIRGEEKLGGGTSVWFQCTSSFDPLGQGLGSFCGRNSGIGFRGGFGNVFAGTWDTPHKLVTNMARGWWGGTNTLQGGSLVLLAQGSDSNVGNATGSNTFFRRHRRLISYHSPNWGGFTINAAVSSGNEATALPESSPLKPRLYSVGAQFRSGPFFAGVGYEMHDDFNPGAGTFGTAGYGGGSDTGYNVVAGFTFGGARLSAMYMANEWELGGAGTSNPGDTAETDGFAVYLDWRIAGPHALKLQYAKVSDFEVTGIASGSTGAEVYGAAYAYSFSKRTEGYIAYNQMKNDSNASYSFGTIANSTLGGKQQVIGLGLKHSF
jgi:predicted porin